MKSFLQLFCFILLSNTLSAVTIEGEILDESNAPVIGAYIIHYPSENHTHTNDFGKFQLKNVAVGGTLQIIHLGYETSFFPINDLSEKIEIILKPAEFELSEVVVGQQYKKSEYFIFY